MDVSDDHSVVYQPCLWLRLALELTDHRGQSVVGGDFGLSDVSAEALEVGHSLASSQ